MNRGIHADPLRSPPSSVISFVETLICLGGESEDSGPVSSAVRLALSVWLRRVTKGRTDPPPNPQRNY